jgi:hypothetical protein
VRRAIDRLWPTDTSTTISTRRWPTCRSATACIETTTRDNIASFTIPARRTCGADFRRCAGHRLGADRELLQQRVNTCTSRATARTKAPSFAELAAQYSDDEATRSQGGDAGWLNEGEESARWDQAVLRAVFDIDEAGRVSPVAVTPWACTSSS